MLFAKILPRNIIAEEFPPASGDLRGSGQRFGVIDKGQDLDGVSTGGFQNDVRLEQKRTLKHSSSGSVVNGSFLSRGLTN